MRVAKKPYFKNGRLILGNRKKTSIKSRRLILGDEKTQKGGFLGSVLAALAPTTIIGLTKIFWGGRKKDTLKVVIQRPQQLSKRR